MRKNIKRKSIKSTNSKAVQTVTLNEKEVLFSEGDPSRDMYVIQSGSIAIKKNKMNQETTLCVLKSNQIVGEMGFFKNEPRTATAQALTPSKLISLPYSALHQEFKTFPQWVKTLVETIQFRLKDTNEKFLSLSDKLSEENKEKDSLFKKSTLQILFLFQLSYQNQKSSEKNTEEISLSFQALNHLTLIYPFTSHQLKVILKSLKEARLIEWTTQKENDYKIVVPYFKDLKNFIHWFKDQYFIQAENRLILSLKDLALIEKILQFAKEENENFKSLNQISVENFFCNKEEIENIEFLKEKGFLNLEKDEPIEDSKDQTSFSLEFSPPRLEKMVSFWKVIYVFKKNEDLEEDFTLD